MTWGVNFDEEGAEPIALGDGGGEPYEEQVDAQLAAAAAQVGSPSTPFFCLRNHPAPFPNVTSVAIRGQCPLIFP